MRNIPRTEDLFCDLGAFNFPVLISIVGAGGKTSTLFWLAHLFRRYGKRVLITTTTHMYFPTCCPVFLCRDPLRLPAAVFEAPLACCFSAWQAEAGKVRGYSPEVPDALIRRKNVDVVLVEADGAHGFPLKAPAEHEPCIPQSSHCVIAVTGAQMLGRSIGPETVQRWRHFSRLTGATAGESLTLPMLCRLIEHPEGAFKGAPAGSRRIWLLNQLSQDEKLAQGGGLALLNQGRIGAIWAGAVQQNPAITRRLVKWPLR